MKYLFINSVAGFGSTGRIAAEQCRMLMARGHECVIAYGRSKANCDDIPTIQIGTEFDYKLHGVMTRIFDNHGFCSRRATQLFLQKVQEYDPDVIWLHNIHGYYIHIGLLFDYLRTCGKEIRWTLHDCWTFTGHCAYFDFAGCDRWKTGCYDCPQKKSYPSSLFFDSSRQNYRKKRQLFTGLKNVMLITPSKWLADMIGQSFLKEYPVKVVYNSINKDLFKPTDSDFRQKYHLQDKKVILGVASIWEKRKGLDDFLNLSEMLDENYKIVLVGRIPEERTSVPDNILLIHRTDSPQELAAIYSAADVLVNPTHEDNYPTVNLEALACGTPVVTYNTGGSPESLDETCGMVVDSSPEAILEVLPFINFSKEACLKRSDKINNSLL